MSPRKLASDYNGRTNYPFLIRNISEGKNLIFVHIPKTGGTSIGEALGFSTPQPEFNIAKHYTAVAIKSFLPSEIWDNSIKFTFVRNPWTRLLSHFYYRKRLGKISVSDDDLTGFNEWVQENIPEKKQKNLQPQLNWIVDDEENILVDFVGRFENISADFLKLCNLIGIHLPVLKHLNSNKEKVDYQEYYNPKSKQLVAEYYARDMEHFDYKFR